MSGSYKSEIQESRDIVRILSPSHLSDLRIVSQQFAGDRFKKASDLVSWFGPVQGQEYALTKWSFGLRIPSLHESDIEEEFSQGIILRTHLMRSTWHFVHAGDIRWILQLTGPRVDAINSFMYRKLELDQSVFSRSNKILETLLAGKQLTRWELSDMLEKNKISATGMRLGYILMKAEIDGIICSGARQGKHFTYALLDDRAPSAGVTETDEALALLTRKYFRSRGPATINDFATWSALTVSMCRQGIDYVHSEMERITINARDYYVIHNESVPVVPEGPFLLPVYDELIMGYKDRSAIFELLNENQPRADLFFNNMILYKGQVIGTWRRSVIKDRMEFKFNLLTKITRTLKKKLKNEAERFAGFYSFKAFFAAEPGL